MLIEDLVKNLLLALGRRKKIPEATRGNVGRNSMLEEIQWSRLQVLEEEGTCETSRI